MFPKGMEKKYGEDFIESLCFEAKGNYPGGKHGKEKEAADSLGVEVPAAAKLRALWVSGRCLQT